MRLYEAIAIAVEADRKWTESGKDSEWCDIWDARLTMIERNLLPSGSGFDNGTQIVRHETTDKRIVLDTAFHHMTDHGVYDGWSEHRVIVTPSLAHRFDMRITGRDRRDIKSYIGDTVHGFLDSEITWDQLDGKEPLFESHKA